MQRGDNVNLSTISFYATEDRLPDMKTCIHIADFFNVSIDYLAGRSDIRKPIADESMTCLESNILSRLQALDEESQKLVDAFIQGLTAKVQSCHSED